MKLERLLNELGLSRFSIHLTIEEKEEDVIVELEDETTRDVKEIYFLFGKKTVISLKEKEE